MVGSLIECSKAVVLLETLSCVMSIGLMYAQVLSVRQGNVNMENCIT